MPETEYMDCIRTDEEAPPQMGSLEAAEEAQPRTEPREIVVTKLVRFFNDFERSRQSGERDEEIPLRYVPKKKAGPEILLDYSSRKSDEIEQFLADYIYPLNDDLAINEKSFTTDFCSAL